MLASKSAATVASERAWTGRFLGFSGLGNRGHECEFPNAKEPSY